MEDDITEDIYMENPQNKINFIPCLKWVKRGVAKSCPEKIQLTKEELAEIIQQTKTSLQISSQTGGETSNADSAVNLDDEYNFANYDNENDEIAGSTLGIVSLAELPNEAEENFNDSDDSDKEDDIIKSDDNLIIAGRVDGDASILEIYVYNESEGSLYVHHDLLLPSFPLCIEWLDHEPGQPAGSYCAIGMMEPIIEVWDLDIVNCLEPAYKLGRAPSRRKGLARVGHTDAVLDLSWNSNYHHILASGSVDQTILLWDIDQGEPSLCIKAFNEKVQCLQWHKLEAQTLLAGGCDHFAKVFDCRTPDNHQTWKLSGEAEKIIWNPLEPFQFIVGTSTGCVHGFDCRQGQMWVLEAHSKEITGLALSGQCPGLLVTTSSEGDLKVWDAQQNTIPRMIHERNMKMGIVHTLELCPNSPFIIASGGDNKSNNFTVLDLLLEDVVKHQFGTRELVQLVSESENN